MHIQKERKLNERLNILILLFYYLLLLIFLKEAHQQSQLMQWIGPYIQVGVNSRIIWLGIQVNTLMWTECVMGWVGSRGARGATVQK